MASIHTLNAIGRTCSCL